jgi:osmoprotectant transport system permease protein
MTDVKIGSKKFTESVILGELVARLTESAGAHAVHEKELGGTQVLWKALLRGDIDVYPEYTGTISHEILSGKGLSSEAEIRDALNAQEVRMSPPLGFNNTYAIGMKEEVASKRNITKISDLRRHADLEFGFTK